MAAKDLRYEITGTNCEHEDTGTHRGRWRASVRLLAINRVDGALVASEGGKGYGAAARVAMREAINDAFSQLAAEKRRNRSTRGGTR